MNVRTPRPRARSVWLDPRFLVGLVLVVASIAGVWLVVAAARQTTPVLVAARTLVAGDAVASGDVRVVEVALGQLDDTYAAALEAGAVAVRTVPAGELVPADALDTAEAVRTTTVVVPSSTAVPASVGPGTRVELWVAPRAGQDGYETPRILIADATVAAVVADDSLVATGGVSLEVVVPRSDVAALLEALADEGLISVVPATGGAG
ncbi:MAG: flagella basal body P-ring formation protein FlgA [Microbacterium sp.]|uniref:SAF domain-containing protein n=1 Tax=Microbacterium sp. TaxID=51671 RepID=UPI0039E45C45